MGQTTYSEEAPFRALNVERAYRQLPLSALVVDDHDVIILATPAALNTLAKFALSAKPLREGSVLPPVLANPVGFMRHRLRRQGVPTAVSRLDQDTFVLACLIGTGSNSRVLLLFEQLQLNAEVDTAAEAMLTLREREIARLVPTGLSNRKIAERLHLTEYTVEGHLKSIFAKMNVPSRAALVAVLMGSRNRRSPEDN